MLNEMMMMGATIEDILRELGEDEELLAEEGEE